MSFAVSLEKYRAEVKELIRKRNGEPIYNGSMDHAAVIIENLFENAEREISILSGKLNARVYGRDEVVKQAVLFLAEPGRKLRILLDDVNQEQFEKHQQDHPFFTEILSGGRPNVEVFRMPEDKHGKYDFHFAVMDNDSYRFEPDKKRPSAVAAFGDVNGADNLCGVFDAMLKDAQPLRPAVQV